MHHLHSLLEDTVDVVAMNGTDSDTPIPNGLAPLPEARTDADPSPTTMRFRAGTVDEAIADATAEIGREVEVIEASRIRRGGLGGFFAHDLGVEIVVAAVSPPGRTRQAQPGADVDTGTGTEADGCSASAPRPRQVNSDSFASHFARHLALDPVDTHHTEPHDNAPDDNGPDDNKPDDNAPNVIQLHVVELHEGEQEPHEQPATPTLRPRRVSTNVRRAQRSSPTPTNDPAPSVDSTAPSAAPAPAVVASADMLTCAVNAFVERLAHTTPVEGSRLGDLARLRLKLTTSGGDVIELTAELKGK